MRALFVAGPMVGHVLPLTALAGAFRDAGHDVVVATAADGIQAARRAGLPVRDVAPGLNMQRIGLGALVRHPVHVGRMARGDEGTEGVGWLFAAVNARMAGGVVSLAEEWRPDLVLHEGLMPAGALAAGRRGVPSVLVDALIYDGGQLYAAVSSRLDGLARRLDVQTIPYPADAVVAIPPSLAGERRGRLMRYVPAPAGGEVPGGLGLDDGRPAVLVSRSTVDDPRPDRMMSRVVEAAEDADVRVVLVRPDRAVSRRALPPNVTTTDWVPFAAVMPHVAGVVTHGGAGTVMTALAAGVPLLVVPGAGDRALHARLVAARGAGLAVPAQDITATVLERLVQDRGLRQSAGEVAGEIAAMPAPAELVEPLAALAR
ncbi:glycosyltransferase [Blastococcus sp. PRF04-17]|uniref:glycosyltransferase n=1 Tax=Blastococcus sp. PRF04-17 TaxID=2933797 RepID=UPI001FF1F8C9|nr:glycosyltransferase [Blastococcus sp. PRF04-17]UOY03057.1 glycosyltransferase [Blastococcus sp. PRF04-17]